MVLIKKFGRQRYTTIFKFRYSKGFYFMEMMGRDIYSCYFFYIYKAGP